MFGLFQTPLAGSGLFGCKPSPLCGDFIFAEKNVRLICYFLTGQKQLTEYRQTDQIAALLKNLAEKNSLRVSGLTNLSARGFILNKLIGHPQAKSISAVLYLAENRTELKKYSYF